MTKSREDILDELNLMVDEKYRKFNSSLCPNTDNMLGVRVPQLRQYAKYLAKEDWTGYYDVLTNNTY